MKQINLRIFLVYILLFAIPFGTRIIYNPDQSYIGGVFSYTQAIFLYGTDILFVALFFSWFLFGGISKKSYKHYVALMAFIIWLFLSLFHVKQLDLGLYHAAKWLELSILILVISQTLSRESIPKAIVVIMISALIQAILGIWQFHVQHMIGLGWLGEYIAQIGTPGLATIDVGAEKLVRAYGTFPHPNIYSSFLILGVMFSLYLVSRATGWRKLLVSCGTVVLILGVFLSFSRLAWGMAVLTVIVFTIHGIRSKSYKTVVFYAGIVLVSCATIVAFYTSLLKERSQELNSESNSVVLRESFNRMAISTWKLKPLTGIGIGQYISEMQNQYDLKDWQYQPPHSLYLMILVELGIVGLMLFLWFLWTTLRFTWNAVRKTPEGFALISAFIIFLIISNFDHYFATIQQGQLMFFALIGLMLAAARSETQNASSN